MILLLYYSQILPEIKRYNFEILEGFPWMSELISICNIELFSSSYLLFISYHKFCFDNGSSLFHTDSEKGVLIPFFFIFQRPNFSSRTDIKFFLSENSKSSMGLGVISLEEVKFDMDET